MHAVIIEGRTRCINLILCMAIHAQHAHKNIKQILFFFFLGRRKSRESAGAITTISESVMTNTRNVPAARRRRDVILYLCSFLTAIFMRPHIPYIFKTDYIFGFITYLSAFLSNKTSLISARRTYT